MNALRELPRPEVYTELSAGANGELKAITLASLYASGPTSGTTLHGRIRDLQGNNPAWPTLTASTVHHYCDTFSSAGLVETCGDLPGYYALSEAGARALPRIGRLLDHSLRHEPPLYGYFGPTFRADKDAPWASERRLKILHLVLNADEPRIPLGTVADYIESPENTTSRIIDDLALYGILSASSQGKNKPVNSYFTTDAILQRTARTPFAQDMLDILVNHHAETPEQPLIIRQVADQLIDQGHEATPNFISRVGSRMQQLAEKFGALRIERVYGKGVRSIVWASEDQLRTIDDLFKAIGSDADDTGLAKLEAILDGNEADVNRLIAKGHDASSGIKASEGARSYFDVSLRGILESSNRPLTIRDIWELMQTQNIRYDSTAIKNRLNRLLEEGDINLHETPSGNAFSWEGRRQKLGDVQAQNPSNLRRIAYLTINNPWRTPTAPPVPERRALFRYRQLVGVAHLQEAMQIRNMLTGDAEFDTGRMAEFMQTLNQVEASASATPSFNSVIEEAAVLTQRWKAEHPSKTEPLFADHSDVALSELASSLKISATDALQLGLKFGVIKRKPLRSRQDIDRVELHIGYNDAVGLRVGLRGAQVAAGLVELADNTPFENLINTTKWERETFAKKLLTERRLGWQATRLWEILAACTDPAAFDIFEKTFKDETAENDEKINMGKDNPDIRAAIKICQLCVVRPQCAEWAIVTRSGADTGVIGGLTNKAEGDARSVANAVALELCGKDLKTIYSDYLTQRRAAVLSVQHRSSSQGEAGIDSANVEAHL